MCAEAHLVGVERDGGALISLRHADVKLIPSRTWSSSAASSDGQPSLIGLSLRLCNPQHALEQVGPLVLPCMSFSLLTLRAAE